MKKRTLAILLCLALLLPGCTPTPPATEPTPTPVVTPTLAPTPDPTSTPTPEPTPTPTSELTPALAPLSDGWKILTTDLETFGFTDDSGVVEYMYSLFEHIHEIPLDQLVLWNIFTDGMFGEGTSEEMYIRFCEAPRKFLSYLVLLEEQAPEWGDSEPISELICRRMSGSGRAYYEKYGWDPGEFDRAIAACREDYPDGPISVLLDMIEYEDTDFPVFTPTDIEAFLFSDLEPTSWPVFTIYENIYDLLLDGKEPEHSLSVVARIHEVPLDQVVAFAFQADGGPAESVHDELRARFLESPHKVLSYLVLLENQPGRDPGSTTNTLAKTICEFIASADACWYADSDEFAQTMAACRAEYPDGPVSALLDVMEAEHAASMARNHPELVSPSPSP